MQQIDKLKGVRATVQNKFVKYSTAAAIGVFAAFFAACGGPAANTATGGVDPNETAATVNGKVIKMEEVDRAVKQQSQGQEVKLSPLELAGARLQVLQSLIEQEVMFQKAEKDGTVPTEEEVSRARAVIAAFALPENAGKGVIKVDGKMTELLHLEEAKRVVALSEAISQKS